MTMKFTVEWSRDESEETDRVLIRAHMSHRRDTEFDFVGTVIEPAPELDDRGNPIGDPKYVARMGWDPDKVRGTFSTMGEAVGFLIGKFIEER